MSLFHFTIMSSFVAILKKYEKVLVVWVISVYVHINVAAFNLPLTSLFCVFGADIQMSWNLPLTMCMAVSHHRYVKYLCKCILWLQLFAECVYSLNMQHCLLIMRAQRLHMEGGDYCGITSSHINPTDHQSNSTGLSAALQCLQSTSQGGFILCVCSHCLF